MVLTVKRSATLMNRPEIPLVLCFSGHDPGGGAGIHADQEAVAAQGAHAFTVITALTVQDSSNVYLVQPVAAELIAEQVERLLADSQIQAIKIGLIGNTAQMVPIRAAIERLRVPVICDPVLRAGGGTELAAAPTIAALRERLLPLVDLLTPNAAEARRLAPAAGDLQAAAAALVTAGCRQVLITGGDEPGDEVYNLWRQPDGSTRRFVWPRLPGAFHGAGCTLAAAIAGRIACGQSWPQAIEAAQHYTHAALAQAYRTGRGRWIPRRVAAQPPLRP